MSMIMIDKNYFSVKLSRGNVRLKGSFPRLHAPGKKSPMIILKAKKYSKYQIYVGICDLLNFYIQMFVELLLSRMK